MTEPHDSCQYEHVVPIILEKLNRIDEKLDGQSMDLQELKIEKKNKDKRFSLTVVGIVSIISSVLGVLIDNLLFKKG